MFPDNPDINEMINTLKSGFEDGQESDIKRDSKIFKKTIRSNASTNGFKSVNKPPIIENPVVEKKEEKSNIN